MGWRILFLLAFVAGTVAALAGGPVRGAGQDGAGLDVVLPAGIEIEELVAGEVRALPGMPAQLRLERLSLAPAQAIGPRSWPRRSERGG